VEARLAEALAAMVRFTGKVDAIQYGLGLMKSHFSEADLELVGDGIAPDTSDLAWSDYLSSAWPIAERVVADLNL